MMDKYSDYDMPSASKRASWLLIYAKKIGIVSPNIEQEIARIVGETADYSYTGYCYHGKQEEEAKLRAVFSK
jgi:hypothetical protein